MFDLATLHGTLIVSCQAPVGSPLHDPDVIAAIAEAAVIGGAAGIRANGADHVAAIKRRVDVPVLGLIKRLDADGRQWITPTSHDAKLLGDAGADVIALDATLRQRSLGPSARELIKSVHAQVGCAVLADIDCVQAAREAEDAGADAVATTLAGYTEERALSDDNAPDISLIREVVDVVSCPVIAEGRFQTPAHVEKAFAAGAWAVVVGTAICDPIELTARFASALPDGQPERRARGRDGRTNYDDRRTGGRRDGDAHGRRHRSRADG